MTLLPFCLIKTKNTKSTIIRSNVEHALGVLHCNFDGSNKAMACVASEEETIVRKKNADRNTAIWCSAVLQKAY